MGEKLYVCLDSLGDFIRKTNEDHGPFGRKFPTKCRMTNEQSMWGSLMEMENEFGTIARKHFGIVKFQDVKDLFNSLRQELIEKDLDKYKEQILNNAVKNMIA